MGVFKTYLMPFDEFGEYTSFQDISQYVNQAGLSDFSLDVDSLDYQLGVYRNSNLNVQLDNRTGKFSDVDAIESIFKYKRADSQVKVTYRQTPHPPICGVAIAGYSSLAEEITVFKGILNDDSFSGDLVSDVVKFNILGYESLFSAAKVPFGTISNGQLMSVIMYNILNQTKITDLLTVSQANITPNLDQTIDSISSLQNKTVKESLDKLLLATNSVLYILNDTVYVKPRTASTNVMYTFYGQASTLGPENIVKIDDIKNGLSKTFNFISWKSASAVGENQTSSALYGIRKKELDLEFVTNGTKQQNIIDRLILEFGEPKQEFNLTTPANYKTLALNLLDKVQIDYPTVYASSSTPICGVAQYGVDQLPEALWSFTVTLSDYYKIIRKKVNPNTQLIEFRLRKI